MATPRRKRNGCRDPLPEEVNTICKWLRQGLAVRDAIALAEVSPWVYKKWVEVGKKAVEEGDYAGHVTGACRRFYVRVERALARHSAAMLSKVDKAARGVGAGDWRAAVEKLARGPRKALYAPAPAVPKKTKVDVNVKGGVTLNGRVEHESRIIYQLDQLPEKLRLELLEEYAKQEAAARRLREAPLEVTAVPLEEAPAAGAATAPGPLVPGVRGPSDGAEEEGGGTRADQFEPGGGDAPVEE
jgi:hypothetical protein